MLPFRHTGCVAFRMEPYIKAVTTFPGGMSNTTFSLLMNKDKWDSLTAEQQTQVMSVSGAHVSSKGPGMDRIANGAMKKLQAKVAARWSKRTQRFWV